MPDWPRPISAPEAAIVSLLLAEAAMEGSALATVSSLRVVDGCRCGCASVEFEATFRRTVIAEATGHTTHGEAVQIFLWGSPYRVTGLEIIGHSQTVSGLPAVENVVVHRRASPI
jgi:hypothetical protein